jgi:hypothetical protein
MSMAQGFAQGFGMMNNFMQQQDAKERQAATEAENARRYDESISYRNNRDTVADTRYEDTKAEQARLKNVELGLKGFKIGEGAAPLEEQALGLYAQQKAKEDELFKLEKQKTTASIAASKASTANTWLDMRAKSYKFDNEQVQDSLARIAGGYGNNDDLAKLNKSMPGLVEGYTKRAPMFDKVAQDFNGLNTAFEQAKTPEEQAALMQQFREMSKTPEWRNVSNSAFMSSLTDRLRAEDSNIDRISFSGWEPVNGGLIPMMNIVYKNGDVKEHVPATKNKTGDAKDTVVILPTGVVKQQYNQAFTLKDFIVEQAKGNPSLSKAAGLQREVKTGYGERYYADTGERVPDSSSSGTSKQELNALDFQRKAINDERRSINYQLSNEANTEKRAELVARLNVLDAQTASLGAPADKVNSTAGQPSVPANMQSTTGGYNKDMIMQRLQMQTPKQ